MRDNESETRNLLRAFDNISVLFLVLTLITFAVWVFQVDWTQTLRIRSLKTFFEFFGTLYLGYPSFRAFVFCFASASVFGFVVAITRKIDFRSVVAILLTTVVIISFAMASTLTLNWVAGMVVSVFLIASSILAGRLLVVARRRAY